MLKKAQPTTSLVKSHDFFGFDINIARIYEFLIAKYIRQFFYADLIADIVRITCMQDNSNTAANKLGNVGSHGAGPVAPVRKCIANENRRVKIGLDRTDSFLYMRLIQILPLAAIREQALGRYANIIVVANNVFPHLFSYK